MHFDVDTIQWIAVRSQCCGEWHHRCGSEWHCHLPLSGHAGCVLPSWTTKWSKPMWGGETHHEGKILHSALCLTGNFLSLDGHNGVVQCPTWWWTRMVIESIRMHHRTVINHPALGFSPLSGLNTFRFSRPTLFSFLGKHFMLARARMRLNKHFPNF